MHRTGLCPRGEEDDAVRWIAIRHGPDHIHLVAMLARQDRVRPRIVNERYRVRDACLAAEQRYGLRSTAPADRTAARSPSRAETGKAARHGRGEPPRLTLRRHVSTAAAGAGSGEEFFARLDQAGVLVRLRYSVTNPGQVTGYAIALPGDTAGNGEPVWYGGGKLAADLSWPRLAQRWIRPARPDPPLSAAEADAMWEYAARTAADATARIRYCTATGNPAAAADAASAASDALHVAAAALGSRALRQAADSLDRAARQPYGRVPDTHLGREPAPSRRPAHRRLRLPHRRPHPDPGRAAGAPRRPGRGRRRTPRVPAARRPGCRRAPRRPAPPRRHQARPARPATRQARHGYRTVRAEIRPAPAGYCRRPGPAQLPRRAPPAAARIRAARTWPWRSAPATPATATSATPPRPLSPDGPASRFTGPDAGCLTARLYGRACKLPVQACEGCPRLLVYRLPGQDTGLAGQPDDPLDLVGQAEGFGVADGGGQHGLGGALVSGPGEHFSGGDPLDDLPVRGRRPAAQPGSVRPARQPERYGRSPAARAGGPPGR